MEAWEEEKVPRACYPGCLARGAPPEWLPVSHPTVRLSTVGTYVPTPAWPRGVLSAVGTQRLQPHTVTGATSSCTQARPAVRRRGWEDDRKHRGHRQGPAQQEHVLAAPTGAPEAPHGPVGPEGQRQWDSSGDPAFSKHRRSRQTAQKIGQFPSPQAKWKDTPNPIQVLQGHTILTSFQKVLWNRL